MAREELGRFGGIAALIATLTIMLIIVAILAMVVVNSLAASSWGVWSVGLTIPIALLMGFYLRYLRPGKVFEVSIIGIVLLVLAIASGAWIENTAVASALHLSKPFWPGPSSFTDSSPQYSPYGCCWLPVTTCLPS